MKGHAKNLPINQKVSAETLAVKAGQGCSGVAAGGHSAVLTAGSPAILFFQHKLLGMRSYICTFLLTKPVFQKFRNAGLDRTSWIIKYDVLLLKALLQVTFFPKCTGCPFKSN